MLVRTESSLQVIVYNTNRTNLQFFEEIKDFKQDFTQNHLYGYFSQRPEKFKDNISQFSFKRGASYNDSLILLLNFLSIKFSIKLQYIMGHNLWSLE